MTGLPRSHRVVAWLCALLVLAAMANAFWYACRTANPVIVSDNWFYLERVVYPYAHGTMQPQDLLVKRSAFDHSQPLRRVLLLLNYEFFDLDFRIEAMFGALVGALNLLLLGWLARRELRDGMALSALAFAALAAVYLSLSATVVFTWSLLTLAFTSHLVLFLWLAMAWRALATEGAAPLWWTASLTFLMGLIADDTGLVATIAGVMAMLLLGGRARRWRRALQGTAAIIGGWIAYSLFYRAVAPPMEGAAGLAASASLEGLLASAQDLWTWITVPLGAALVHRSTLRPWLGEHAETAIALLAIGFAVAHLWFWWQAWRGGRNRPAFIAIVLMLMFYGLVAGLLVGRISSRGTDYLWQPRYAMAYRWHVIALLLMLVAQAPRLAASARPRLRAGVGAVLALLLLAQAGLGAVAWEHSVYSRQWNRRVAQQLASLAAEPGPTARGCVPQLIVCRYRPAQRDRLVRFLDRNRLSVFSPDVRRRNGLAPPGAGD